MKVPEEEYIVRLIELPYKVNGLTVCDENGFYNIYINSRLSLELQNKAYKHELSHIAEDDFYNDKPIELCEALAER